MNHDREEWLKAVEDSIDFYSSGNKGASERWVCTEFLKNIGLHYEPAEVVSRADDPPDVIFRKASFEVKEILDRGRR